MFLLELGAKLQCWIHSSLLLIGLDGDAADWDTVGFSHVHHIVNFILLSTLPVNARVGIYK